MGQSAKTNNSSIAKLPSKVTSTFFIHATQILKIAARKTTLWRTIDEMQRFFCLVPMKEFSECCTKKRENPANIAGVQSAMKNKGPDIKRDFCRAEPYSGNCA